jgi:ribose-phosphate pyrophosphokinase
MANSSDEDLKFFCGRSNPELGEEIADALGTSLGDIRISKLADSETHVQIEESVRGKNVFILQSTCEPVNDNLMELLIILDACRRASAREITAVVPYFGYARQDHKSTGREVSVDLHATQIQGFFTIPMDHLTAVPVLAGHFKQNALEDPVVVAPDVGRTKLAEKYTDILHLPMALMTKRRRGVGGGEMEVLSIVGDVKGKTPILIDDVIASGSIVREAEHLVGSGSREVHLAITHPALVGPALEWLKSPAIKQLVVTNTIPVPQLKRLGGKVTVLSIAPLLAQVIQRIHRNQSVSRVFLEDNLSFPV